MEEQANPLERDHCLSVVLPGGLEENATVHGSKPVMDLLVTLCASHHLNPSDYTVEVLSPNKNNISFKPNSPIGSLEADTIVLKPKGMEEKIRRPYMPEPSVRLLINYNKSHKAVVRVSPRVPLETLLPVVCDKCEFEVETTVLLRDSQSEEPLDLTETLNDLGLREVFAKDTADLQPPRTPEAAVPPPEAVSPPPPRELPKKEKKPKDNTGFLSLFRRRKKKGETSVPASPGVGVTASCSNTLPADVPKKRRAPQPPLSASQSVPNLGSCHVGASQRSAESTLTRTKRRAPPPPCADGPQEPEADPEVKGTLASLNAAEELRESDESDSGNLSLPSSSSSSSHLRSSSSSSRPSFARLHEVTLPSFRGRDLSDARCALAKVLTSSVSKGTLVQRLRNSASFPKFSSGASLLTPRVSDNGLLSAHLERVQTSTLPAEHEDPAQRKGMTTFKVVPSKTPKPVDPELAPDQMAGGDDPEREAPLEAEREPAEAEEDPPSPDGSEAQTPLQSPEPLSQETPSSAPPSPGLENRESPGVSEVTDSGEKQTEEDEPEVPSEVTPADCSDEEPTSEGQEDQTEGQSPGGLSASTEEEEPEEEPAEEVVREEEEQDHFPSPPPPIFFEHAEEEDTTASSPPSSSPPSSSPPSSSPPSSSLPSSSLPSSQPPSPTSNGQTRAFTRPPTPATPAQPAAPKPLDKMSAAPSRFAQAVALAVEKSRLQSGGNGLGPQEASGPLPSPPRATYQYGA